VSRVTFLGTGDYLTLERYWNGFVLDGQILVEPSPTALPHLRRCGLQASDLQAVFVSHFHADHTFGWPFLLLELIRSRRRTPISVVGPPGVQRRLAEMLEVGAVQSVGEMADAQLDVRYVEVDGTWQTAGPIRFRAVQVDHVPYLDCFGFLFDLGGRTVAYSGDVRPCGGLDTLAENCDVLILECNGPHPPPQTHMDVDDVVVLRERFPDPRFILTHLGAGLNDRDIPNCTVPGDFETLTI
jgi:ribonuclease BN (tRNA processing enzyme)